MTGTRLTATVLDRIFIGACASDQLLLSPDGGRMYVPTQDPCAIFVIETSNGAGVARIGLPTFRRNNGFDYESGEEAAILHEDDEDDNTHRAHHPAFALSGSQLLVTTEHREAWMSYCPGVCVIDIGTLPVAKTFPPPHYATKIARAIASPDGCAFLLSMDWPRRESCVSTMDIRGKVHKPFRLCQSAMFPALPVLSPITDGCT